MIHHRHSVVSDTPLHDNALAHRVLAARGLTGPEDTNLTLAGLPTPDALPDIARAVERLMVARAKGERVLIVGDYDCDGATSTSVAMLGLSMLGFTNLAWRVPNRFTHGYGLSPAIVNLAHREDAPDLLVTVDNGVASVDGVDRASELGIDVLVTDHHLPPDVLPRAVAVVNPNLKHSEFGGKALAGVGVIFYVLLALRAELKRRGDPHASARLADLLDLVAIGTVADVVPLDRVNRILVEQGLRRIRAAHTRPGVLALLQRAGREHGSTCTSDIGFALGPRLNAAGRLDDIGHGIRCLLSTESVEAGELAETLDRFNRERRQIEQEMRAEAEQIIESRSLEESTARQRTFGIVLHDAQWHQGVIGILAGRLKESLHRPVAVFTSDDDGGVKGSVRSIPGVHVRDVLQSIAESQPGLISAFGGHAMAAGLSMPEASLEAFSDGFDAEIRKALSGKPPVREWLTDGSLAVDDRTLDNAQMLRWLMPWGQGFEAPSFDDVFEVVSSRIVGSGHLKMSLCAPNSDKRGSTVDAIAFGQTQVLGAGDRIHCVYALDVNTWRDVTSLQLMIHHLELAPL